MKRWRENLIYMAAVGMELSWLYAWATFSLTFIPNRPFPLPEAIGTFVLAATLTFLSIGRGLRVFQVLGLQLLGLLLAGSRIIYLYTDTSHPYFSREWIWDFFNKPREPLEWIVLIFILFWILCFWLGGVTLAKRPTAYRAVTARFDLGVVAFLALLLLKFLILFKGGTNLRDPFTDFLFFPFFIFGLTAVGLSRNRSDVQREYLSGYQGMGVILSFTMVVLLFGTGLVLLFLPYLTLAAEMGDVVIKEAAQPLEPILVSVLRFIFMRESKFRESPQGTSNEPEINFTPSVEEGSWWMELLSKIGGWGLTGIVVLMGLIALGFALYYLTKWLLSRTAHDKEREGLWHLILLWASSLWAILTFLMEKMRFRREGPQLAVHLYKALLGWGRHSGLPHLISETPTEYRRRLSHRFPVVKKEVGLITEAFNRHVYGSTAPGTQQLDRAGIAWRKMRSPLHWPFRLKSWFSPSVTRSD
jgi:hypothetical protein